MPAEPPPEIAGDAVAAETWRAVTGAGLGHHKAPQAALLATYCQAACLGAGAFERKDMPTWRSAARAVRDLAKALALTPPKMRHVRPRERPPATEKVADSGRAGA